MSEYIDNADKYSEHKDMVKNLRKIKEHIEHIESGECFAECMRTINSLDKFKVWQKQYEDNIKKYKEENKGKIEDVVMISDDLQRRVEEVIKNVGDQWFYDDSAKEDEQNFYTCGELDWYAISEMNTDEDIKKIFCFDSIDAHKTKMNELGVAV